MKDCDPQVRSGALTHTDTRSPLSVMQVGGAIVTGETLEAEAADVLQRGDGLLLTGVDIADV